MVAQGQIWLPVYPGSEVLRKLVGQGSGAMALLLGPAEDRVRESSVLPFPLICCL